MRLIDADKMKEYMKNLTSKELMENEEVFEIIDEQPTVPVFGQWHKLTFTELAEAYKIMRGKKKVGLDLAAEVGKLLGISYGEVQTRRLKGELIV